MAIVDGGRTDLCLFVPPFASVNFPQLGTAVLKGACQSRGIATRVVYGNLALAAQIGVDAYESVEATPMRAMMADHLFRDFAYPPEIAAGLPPPLPMPADLQALFDTVAPAIEPIIAATVAEIVALRPRILGLSSTFQQNMVCSAIAWRVKALAPDICIVLGGANAAALDRPRSRASIRPELRDDVEWLVRCGYVIDYEDRLVGIVVRPAPVLGAPQPADRAADAFSEAGTSAA